jgi:hypothetical protein
MWEAARRGPRATGEVKMGEGVMVGSGDRGSSADCLAVMEMRVARCGREMGSPTLGSLALLTGSGRSRASAMTWTALEKPIESDWRCLWAARASSRKTIGFERAQESS